MTETKTPYPVSNETPQDASDQFGSMTDAVVPLFDLPDEAGAAAFRDFVANRVVVLSEGEPQPPIGGAYGGTDQFIKSDTDMIISSLMSRPYRMDDPAAYEATFPYLKQYYKQFLDQLPPDKAFLNAAIQAASVGQAVYFQSYKGDPGKRSLVTANVISEAPQAAAVSIAEFGSGAMCQERAAVAHNTLHILGIPSVLVNGDISVKDKAGTEHSESHAFLIVPDGEASERFIFDPTNPIVYRDNTGNIQVSRAATYKLELDESGAQQVTLTEYNIVNNGVEPAASREVTYSVRPGLL